MRWKAEGKIKVCTWAVELLSEALRALMAVNSVFAASITCTAAAWTAGSVATLFTMLPKFTCTQAMLHKILGVLSRLVTNLALPFLLLLGAFVLGENAQ